MRPILIENKLKKDFEEIFFLVNKIFKILWIISFWNSIRMGFFGIFFGILLRILFEILFEILMEILLGILSGLNLSAGGVCGCAVVGKEKFDLMTGRRQKSITRSARLTHSRA